MKRIYLNVRFIIITAIVTLVLAACGYKEQISNQSLTNDAAHRSKRVTEPITSHKTITDDSHQIDGYNAKTNPSPNLESGHNQNYVENSSETPKMLAKKQKVKGIYVSAWSTTGKKFNQLVNLVESTDLNAMVIDVKTDSGQVTYPSQIPLIKEVGANSRIIIPDLKEKLELLKNKQIYTIARVVVFKDPYLSNIRSNWAMRTKDGKAWNDSKGITWLDPFKEEVWDYHIEIAKEVAALGFDEIQFDYVRFPENGNRVDQEVIFDNPKSLSKANAIQNFLKRAKSEVGNKAFISADVFGLTTSAKKDMGIGQDWSLITTEIDTISPMIYPSHYASGVYGVKHPDLQPYAIVQQAITDAKAKNDAVPRAAAIRPWLQDFTATWVKPHRKYTGTDVKEQIKAAKELGVEEFLLWNSTSTYTYR